MNLKTVDRIIRESFLVKQPVVRLGLVAITVPSTCCLKYFCLKLDLYIVFKILYLLNIYAFFTNNSLAVQ